MVLHPDALFQCLRSDLTPYLGDLSSLLGTGVVPVGISFQEAAALSLGNSFLKKFCEERTADADAEALRKFLESNDRCSSWELHGNNSMDEILLGTVKSVAWEFFNPGGYPLELGPNRVFYKGIVGPGASVGALANDFYTKMYAGPISCTDQSLYTWYNAMIKSFPTWTAAEKLRMSAFGEPLIVQGNRLSFVPKTTKVSRSICVEPTLNMWYQLGCYEILSRRLLSRFGIDLSDQQEKNRTLACRGSIDGSFGTIDLESASDSVATKMLEWLLPSWVFRDLSKYRSPSVRLPDSDVRTLHMFSSMGNGFTFPLQTIVFTCVVLAVYRVLGITPLRPDTGFGNYGVFGDDIICVANSYDYIVRCLGLLGFRVNSSKSYNLGPFRESCGADYYRGRNIRGVYLKSSQLPSIFAAINQLVLFTSRTGVCVPSLSQLLRRKVPWNPIPLWENDDAGIRTPLSFFTPRTDLNGSYAYYAYKPIPSVLRVKDDRVVAPKRSKKRFFNEWGLHCAFLAGRLTSMTIPIRHDRARYRKKLSVAPNWEYSWRDVTETSASRDAGGWKRCESAFYMNL
ncbi:RNA-directed RNA polymerase [ssRNA phage Zoerhiza.3_2]|uniref:RNA-directed RNA polymerase n=2 Tax=Norzivirales TaxID=2842247 RepID=A0A8S5L3Y7_9VIRU|nr:RNA-directed RNA polymerase [ssRNA phage Zoerhiza.3_2]QDH89781.1 MAG: RNA-dependent RNA polymerase [Leviviridae sp.]DAD52132.1 TPA_asm: RNA-directed RNA polymerase [ssRNA phage Zoerhiza.3_2]